MPSTSRATVLAKPDWASGPRTADWSVIDRSSHRRHVVRGEETLRVVTELEHAAFAAEEVVDAAIRGVEALGLSYGAIDRHPANRVDGVRLRGAVVMVAVAVLVSPMRVDIIPIVVAVIRAVDARADGPCRLE
jgi:hypothetical protein